MEKKNKHLEFIQLIITRMAVNSFLLKGWTVTIIAGIFALSAKDTNQRYLYITFFPLIIFWILDGYYLYQERLYRSLYEQVRKLDEKDIHFSLNAKTFKKEKGNNWISSIFSDTLLIFYCSLIALILFIIIVII